MLGDFEVVDELGLMFGQQGFDGFDFKDDEMIHDQIGAVFAHGGAVKYNLEWAFCFEGKATFTEGHR